MENLAILCCSNLTVVKLTYNNQKNVVAIFIFDVLPAPLFVHVWRKYISLLSGIAQENHAEFSVDFLSMAK